MRPDPRAILYIRDCVNWILGLSSSSLHIESMMQRNMLIRALPSDSLAPFGISSDIPGIIDITLFMGPSFLMFSNCSYMSRNVNTPSAMRLYRSGFSSMPASFMELTRPEISPMPSRRPTNVCGLKGSNASVCSPVPMNVMGAPVALTALSAPPPFALPSSFVTTMEPTFTLSRNAAAWSCAAWPMLESMTKTTSSGETAASMAAISSKSAASCMWRPEVSTMMSS
mmetsp:Transcript_19350/g.48411  ORF Transcript_19350/g.48411 Transcript_19350/m.48411 type:complete len:226 (+) Transcript_19350:268-945(+)